MTPDDAEKTIRRTAAEWVFIQAAVLVDKTEHALKMRLHIDSACFVQIYANPQKDLLSYTLVLNRSRIYGRDCVGGEWHRHPFDAPESHDFSQDGSRSVTLSDFLAEVQQILMATGLL